MKVAVCDDVCIDRQKLCSLLDGYAKDKNMDLDVCAFSSGEALLEVYKGQFTILFLDI